MVEKPVYELKCYRDNEEVEISEMPKEFLQGIIEICRNEIASEKRLEQVCKRMMER